MKKRNLVHLTHSANLANSLGQAVVAATSSHANYPISNIKTPKFSQSWRSNDVLSNVDITIDLGSAIPINLSGLFNTNLTAAATVTHAAGTTSGVSDYSNAIAWRSLDEYALLQGTITYRYHRLRITDAANPHGFLEAAYLPLGQASEVPVNHRYEGSPFPGGMDILHVAQNMMVRSEFGQPFVDRLYSQTDLTCSFGDMSTVNRIAMLRWLNSLEEELDPLILIPAADDLYDGYFCRLVTSVRELWRQFHTLGPVTFRTDGRGKRMAA